MLREAIAAYDATCAGWQPPAYGARVDLAASYVIRGDLSNAADVLAPVFGLPADLRIAVLTGRLDRVRRLLGEAGRTSRHAAAMIEAIDAWAADAPAVPARVYPALLPPAG